MRTITANFKNTIKNFGREFDDKITYIINNQEHVITQDDIYNIEMHYETKLLSSTMKQLDITVTEQIPIGTVVKCEIGLKVLQNYDYVYEYVNLGNYIIKNVERQEDMNAYKYTCYDKMLLTMIDYTNLDLQFPITVRNYINSLCTFLGITFANNNENFINCDKVLSSDPFLNEDKESTGYKFRDVFDDLAEVTASNICINANDELELRYINYTDDTIDEEYLKDTNINFEKKFGPINSIVLSRAASSDNVYLQNDYSVEHDGLCEVKIEDNQIMNFNDRSEYLDEILDELEGVEFYIFDVESTGVLYYEVYDMFNISIGETVYPCLMLNNEIMRTQGLQENIFTPDIEETNTDYSKADKTDIRINQTYIIADKQKGEIEALTSRVSTIEEQTGDTYTIEQINQLVQDAVSGITNTFSEAGGNNILRNTGLWFVNTENDSAQNPYEFWTGLVAETKEEEASNMRAMLLKDGTVYQQQTVPNGNYTLTFAFKNLIELAETSVIINDTEYELIAGNDNKFTNTFSVTDKSIKIEFECNIDDGCEIYDLMLNAGEVGLAYSQNQNETTTDTVNISKGITITSSNTDTTFKANADGIRTLDKSGNELTKFTDTGMTTKRMIAEDTSQIVGLLFQEVNGQTWITRL